jgi:hypothetical protein
MAMSDALDEAGLEAAFKAHTAGQDKFTRRMAITIADHFGMTPMQLVRYYEGRRTLKPGSARWFLENGGITREHIEEVRGSIDHGQ